MSKTDHALGLLGGVSAGKRQSTIDISVQNIDKGLRSIDLVLVKNVLSRIEDTRPAKAEHILALAESIAALGLLQPIAVDKTTRLVAGLHRLEAAKLLILDKNSRFAYYKTLPHFEQAEEWQSRLTDLPEITDLAEPLRSGKIPARMLDFDSSIDPSGALAAEAAENTARRSYSANEVAVLAERLKNAGYIERRGRPKAGEKALRPALGIVLGLGEEKIRRLLEKSRLTAPTSTLQNIPFDQNLSDTLDSLIEQVDIHIKSLNTKSEMNEVHSLLKTLKKSNQQAQKILENMPFVVG